MLFLFLLLDAGTGGFFPIADIGKASLKIGMSSSSCLFPISPIEEWLPCIYCHPMLSTINNTQAWMTRLRETLGRPLKSMLYDFVQSPGLVFPVVVVL